MAYTTTIVTSSGTVSFVHEPFYEPEIAYDWNRNVSPPTLAAITERWTLRHAGVSSGTEATVTSDWTALLAALATRSVTITSVNFKRDGSTLYTLTSTTHDITIEGIRPEDVGPGTWKNHLFYTITFSALRRYNQGGSGEEGSGADDPGVVGLEQQLRLEYDAAGLLTKTLTGRVTTKPGTSAQTVAEGFGLSSPGATFGCSTNGQDQVSVTVEDWPRDTIATFVSVWREHGLTVPSNIGQFGYVESVRRDASGGLMRVRDVRAAGTTLAAVENALAGKSFGAGEDSSETRVDQAARDGTASYTQRGVPEECPWNIPLDAVLPREVIDASYALSASGGGWGADVFTVPGADPVLVPTARLPLRVSEQISLMWRGVLPDRLPPPFDTPFAPDFHVSGEDEETAWTAERTSTDGLVTDWRKTVRRSYLFPARALYAPSQTWRGLESAAPQQPTFGRA